MRTPLALVVLLTAACSSSPPTETPITNNTSTTTSASTVGRCEDVAQDGARVTDQLIDKGCTDDNGSLRVGTVTTCRDGRRLWEMGNLIGLSGETLLPRDVKGEGGVTVETLARRVCRC